MPADPVELSACPMFSRLAPLQLARIAAASLSQWLHRLLDQLENETFLNARAKLASHLLSRARGESAGQAPCRVELTQPKKDVASQLGMAPETFSRAQANLESRGLIRTFGRRIEIPDRAALERLLFEHPLG